jgi:hypothetical protein
MIKKPQPPSNDLRRAATDQHVFANTAPAYFDHGFTVLPLQGKAPLIKKWSSYCDNLPKVETRADWLTRFPDANLGLGLGKEIIDGYRLGVLDVDDDRYVRLAEAIIGRPAPGKFGKKGRVGSTGQRNMIDVMMLWGIHNGAHGTTRTIG